MTVVALSAVSPGLRGEISKWMVEPAPGVFLGRISAVVADGLWRRICSEVGEGWAVMGRSAATDQGFALRTAGESRREIVDIDGLFLVRMTPADVGS